MILYIMGGSAVTLVIIVLIYFILSKKCKDLNIEKFKNYNKEQNKRAFQQKYYFKIIFNIYKNSIYKKICIKN